VLVIKLAETTGKRRNDTAKKKEPVEANTKEQETGTEITWSNTEKKGRKASNKRTSKPRSYFYFVNMKESAKRARR
jgi:hypothetical protein